MVLPLRRSSSTGPVTPSTRVVLPNLPIAAPAPEATRHRTDAPYRGISDVPLCACAELVHTGTNRGQFVRFAPDSPAARQTRRTTCEEHHLVSMAGRPSTREGSRVVDCCD